MYFNLANIPLFAFGGLLLGQTLAEYAAMLRTGTLRRKHRREWTYYAVAIPFKAMLGATIAEHIGLQTHPTSTMVAAGSILAAGGIIVRVRAHLELDGAFSQYVEKSESQRLVQSGMYAKIRHPMYIGSILLFAGMPLVLAARWAWIFSGLGMVGIIIRIRKEEDFLVRELPGYREYTQRTWRLMPHMY